MGEIQEIEEHYDLMRIIMICLGTAKDARYTGLLKLLDVFMSNKADMEAKSSVLMTEFGADMPTRLKNKEEIMCNYSDFVENRGRDEGRIEGKVEDIWHLMNNLKLNMEDAFRGLSIPEEEWEDYRKRVLLLKAQPS